jgi:hypothetical protein
METHQIQQLFFNYIKSKIAPHLSFVDEIAALLNISHDSAYRRIRGEKEIGLAEVKRLCNQYKISLDQLLQIQSGTFIFFGNFIDSTSFGFNAYLQQIATKLQFFTSLDDVHLYYFNKDIPFFYMMQFPELIAFKFFFWKRTFLGVPEFAKRKFSEADVDSENAQSIKKIVEVYNKIPTTEIWNENVIHVTLGQIEYYRQSDIFEDPKILKKIYLQLIELLNHLERQAETGKKILYGQPVESNAGQYELYANDCLVGDNTIFVNSESRQITFLNHTSINYAGTEDKLFCTETFERLKNIIRKSTHISVVGEKERSRFFNILRAKVDDEIAVID